MSDEIGLEQFTFKKLAQRLRLILAVCTRAHHDYLTTTTLLGEAALYRIVVNDASRACLTHDVDEDNEAGLMREYTRLVATLVEAARKQRFFARHLPRFTDA